MITRTPFVEKPNGDLTCTITIPRALRGTAFAGGAITLPELPGAALAPDDSVIVGQIAPTQQLDVGGFDTAEVMLPYTAGQWDHPAAAHLATLNQYAPFQRFVYVKDPPADSFAAPMPHALNFLRSIATNAGPERAKEIFEVMLAEYTRWCAEQGVAPYPKQE